MVVVGIVLCFVLAYGIARLVYGSSFDEIEHGGYKWAGGIAAFAFYTLFQAAKTGNAYDTQAFAMGFAVVAVILLIAAGLMFWMKHANKVDKK